MFRHGPSCLEGPVLRTPGWWSGKKIPAADAIHGRKNRGSAESPLHACVIRSELVQRLRREIAEGRYETPEKWEAALELLWKRWEDA